MMSTSQLFIPKRIKVGFNERTDTYTGRLAYIIYYDAKGKLRKEKSWTGWHKPELGVLDADNTPRTGFVLNKGAGGGWHEFGKRETKIRVYDPLGFEFEITVDNLLFILKETDCTRGKGLEGEYVYAWEKDVLILLPTNSQDYKESQGYTSLQAQKVSAKTLVPGGEYLTKSQEHVVYIGRYPVYNHDGKPTKKQHVFWYRKPNMWDRSKMYESYEYKDGASHLGQLLNGEHPDFAILLDRFQRGVRGSPIVRLYTTPMEYNAYKVASGLYHVRWYHEVDGEFREYEDVNGVQQSIRPTGLYRLVNGSIERVAISTKDAIYPNGGIDRMTNNWYSRYDPIPSRLARWVQPNDQRLCAELASGVKCFVVGSNLKEMSDGKEGS